MLCKTTGPPNSKMFFLGEAPDELGEQTGLPFQNMHGSGKTFNLILSQNGINRRDVRIRNVAMRRPTANNMSHFFYDSKCTVPKPELVMWIEQLRIELEESRPNVVVAMGAYALWALTGIKKISEARGYIIESTLVPGLKVVPTYHPNAINYEWKLFPVAVFDVRKALYHSESPDIPKDKTQYVAPAGFEMFMDYMDTILKGRKRFAFDIEAHIGTAYPYLLGIADSPHFGMSFYNMKGTSSTVNSRQEAQLWQKLGEIAKHCESIMHNASYDKAVMWYHHGVLFENVWMDTLIAMHVIFPEFPRDLGFVGSIMLDVSPWKNLSKVDTAVYNALDAIRTFAISEPLQKEIIKQKMERTYNFEMSMLDPAIMMQLRGVRIDNERRLQLLNENVEQTAAVKMELDNQFKREINFNSSKQMQQLLYYELGLEPQFKRRKSVEQARVLTVDAKAMKKLARKYPNHPWLIKILDYKKLLKLNGFLSAEPSPEGRYHTSYNITGSSKEEEGKKSFGRWSSSASIILTYGPGNLQNIPPKARETYCADEGTVILQADMRQAEAVIVSHLIGDTRLQHFFKMAFTASAEEQSKYDVHKLTASLMFEVDYDMITPEMRRVGKTLRHACSYSAGPEVVANALGIEISEAKILLNLYHKANPLLKVWYQIIQNELRTTRTLTTPMGRKHRFLDIWGDKLFRSAYSYLPQSTIGDFLNESMRIFYDKYGDDIDIIMQLHDAIYVQCKPDAVSETMEKLTECMVRPIIIGFEEFIIGVDFKVGKRWGDVYGEDIIELEEEVE